MNALQIANELEKLNLGAFARQHGLVPQLDTRAALDKFIGNSAAIQDLRRRVTILSAVSDPVVIRGESGTGKELIARALHGDRGRDNFIGINCTSLPDYLLESELFGHKKGSFTGADSDKVGLFEHAGSGSVFLDEIGDMPLALQAKLLRVLQERTIRRVGDTATRPFNARILAATHRELEHEMESWKRHRGRKGFRPDLYWRLATYTIYIPPLRERVEDIEELLDSIDSLNLLTQEERSALMGMPLYGNVRELEAQVKRTLLEKQIRNQQQQ